ncbi:non-specific lipid-transfer protein 4.1-like [Oryza brachyantha]|uniref:non-specific lipid-transfer protein 4.1-like n=1 Tax=Oryza brachyantha TaxID=4533 RepID=UPI001ADC45E0|nr:non-specific lipid-transfer protein 4.1-like [Oryza brachyantha]
MGKNASRLAAVLVVLLLLALRQLEADEVSFSCSGVISDVSPCMGFLQGDEEHPSSECCDGLSGLAAAAATTEDRQAACECLKSVAGQFTAVEAAPARDLPADCGLSLPYTFSPDVDCSQIE